MKYYKNMINGAVVTASSAPDGQWWREANIHEYRAYKAYVSRLITNLEEAVARKAKVINAIER